MERTARTSVVAAYAAAALALAALVAPVARAQDIDTTPSWNGTNEVASFGETNTATYGQTFTVGAESVLNDYTFWLRPLNNPDATEFRGYVAEWDAVNTRATGGVLFTSGNLTTAGTPGGSHTPYTINTGSLQLVTGKQYVAFLSASQLFDGSIGTSTMGYTGANPYAGGGFVFKNNGSDFNSLFNSSWETFVGGGVIDTAFRANFSSSVDPVPEPGAVAFGIVMGGGLLGLVARGRRRATAA